MKRKRAVLGSSLFFVGSWRRLGEKEWGHHHTHPEKKETRMF